ncbi:hypothetical protein H4Q26_011097 [Puccinia striiformis f. sp. tritici PST-130]|uniref:Uncharacterized protein n=1 Tax=Puccinia striiformis f. sp. tritici PST-78 TaxID=1165861 RepID=A0A0L0VXP8_9BASI|nr:hypothetical protein H4Q26_011097 [Puccinia striiformis f. sp. tritici PST-130]KNF03810.1 hypothetical protein PSTG_02904 [Puccinia striiformis f. sp. tritici PST-78]
MRSRRPRGAWRDSERFMGFMDALGRMFVLGGVYQYIHAVLRRLITAPLLTAAVNEAQIFLELSIRRRVVALGECPTGLPGGPNHDAPIAASNDRTNDGRTATTATWLASIEPVGAVFQSWGSCWPVLKDV